MDKELMLVTSYCDTTEKKEILLECLKSLQPFRNDYSIFLTSHLPLDNFFYDYIDYFYYDKNNYLITDPKISDDSDWFSLNQNFTIFSTYTSKGNTLGSIWSMFIPSIQVVKSLGYKKIHYLEYDSVINNI